MTTVGEQIFAARTRTAAAVDGLDWRRSPDPGIIFERAELPADIAARLGGLCQHSGLVFATHDLIESPDGRFYFLETNPAGQWGWLELALGLPIAAALAAALAQGAQQASCA
ncbi:MAG TPA: hypothetical protein VFW75_06725 [Acetobacteraceae bacterium]|nr:hypothetical protein [Acetobacteraceae bacterium]